MFWNKKEEKSNLPALPPMSPEYNNFPQAISRNNSKESEENSLPSFPEPMNHGFSQAAIKNAVSTEEIGEELPAESKTVEVEEWTPKNLPVEEAYSSPIAKKRHDVYVKIDKFQSGKNALDEATKKLEEIDELLSKIRETKMREEQELSSWEKELTAIKARIQNVSENIFEK